MSLVYQPPVVHSNSNSSDHNDATTNTQKPRPRPGIYIGDKNDAKNYKLLTQRNITYILNVTPPQEASYKTGVPNYFEHHHHPSTNTNHNSVKKSSSLFQYLRIPIYDSAISLTQLNDSIPSIVSFINQAIQYHQSSILIHCQRGISRSVTVAIIYMIRSLNMTYHEAITMIQRRRPLAQPIPEFVTMLQQLEMTCRSSTTMIAASVDRPQIVANCADDNQKNLSTSGSTETKRSISNAIGSNSNRIVGPQRPPPSNTTRTEETASTATTSDVRDDTISENGHHNNKRRKTNENVVGPQRPPPT